MELKDFIKQLQRELNEHGEKLTVDGDPGPKTQAALRKYSSEIMLKPIVIIQPEVPSFTDYFGAPWIGANLDLLGLDETDPRLNARYVPEWALEGLPGYKTLSGNDHAWCSVRANADRRKVGVKGTNSAGASSWSKWGIKSPFWFGAALDIEHQSGGRHICDFLYWIDEKNKIAATLDGNRGNKFCVAKTDLSGKGDKLVTGPRWSEAWPDGQLLSREAVLAQYPMLVPGAVASGTR